MLSKVTRPDAVDITFKYDALGRRIEKSIRNTKTKWLWDGNTPLHEWKEVHIRDYNEEKGHFINIEKHPVTTWVFEDGTFVPTAKLTKEKKLSIVTNYMGTPEAMYDQSGEKTWECTLNSYGKVRNFKGDKKSDCPFRYQGQYEDAETGLYYNRFRYYSPDEGMYISQDPIGLSGGHTLYSYVHDPNDWIDVFGLKRVYAVLEDKDGNVVATGISGASEPGGVRERQNEAVNVAVNNSVSNIENNGGTPPPNSGKCAEINAIDRALSAGYTDFSGMTMRAYYGDPENGGVPWEACDCCKGVLEEFDIKDGHAGCGQPK